jgi:hypothetical protein
MDRFIELYDQCQERFAKEQRKAMIAANSAVPDLFRTEPATSENALVRLEAMKRMLRI